jgi:hypothetical protein
LFLDQQLRSDNQYFANDRETREKFAKFIKEGVWVETLAKLKLLQCREASPTVQEVPVNFSTPSSVQYIINAGENLATTSGSSKCNSASEDDAPHFSGLYANAEARTCFSRDEIQSFLFSVVFPFYLAKEERKTAAPVPLKDSDEYSANSLDYACLGFQENQLLSVQDMLLSAAAYADEAELCNTLASATWINTLLKAIYFCPLSVCVCSVDHAASAIKPVFINDAARKRVSTSGKAERLTNANFLQLFSIVQEDDLLEGVTASLLDARPLRFVSKTTGRGAAMVDVTHIFDASSKHCYVLGVQADACPPSTSPTHATLAATGSGKKELERYLTDSALLISFLIKTGTQMPHSQSPSCPGSPAPGTPVRNA